MCYKEKYPEKSRAFIGALRTNGACLCFIHRTESGLVNKGRKPYAFLRLLNVVMPLSAKRTLDKRAAGQEAVHRNQNARTNPEGLALMGTNVRGRYLMSNEELH